MTKRIRAHDVERRAKEIFEEALPDTMIPREQSHDYGIDYRVELFEHRDSKDSTEPTGIEFAVQLKGTEVPQISGSFITFALEVDHLAYYIDDCRTPVFLFIVDILKRKVFWLFLQKYASTELERKQWRKQKSVTMRIPLNQTLDKPDAFREYVIKAERYVAALHPAAVEASLKAQRKKLESLDPRFSIEVHATEAKQEYIVHAKEPIPFTLNFKGSPEVLHPKLEDFLGRGLPVQFGPNELAIEGSLLLKKFFGEGATLQISRKLRCEIQLLTLGQHGQEVQKRLAVPGTITGGSKEYRFEGQLEGAPLGILLTCQFKAGGNTIVTFSFSPELWRRQPLLHLAYFEPINSFFQNLIEGSLLRVEGSERGNKLFSGTARMQDLNPCRQISGFLRVIEKARQIAAQYHVNPRCPDNWGPETTSRVEDLFLLLHNYGMPRSGKNLSITTHLGKDAVPRLLKESVNQPSGAHLKFLRQEKTFQFLDAVIEPGELQIEVSNAILRTTREELNKSSQEGGDTIKVEWVGTENSVITVGPIKQD